MLTENEIRKKLLGLAQEFRSLVKQRDYAQAKYKYDTARNVAVFLEVKDRDMDMLFGIKGEKGSVIQKGEFPEEMVQKVYEMTVVRAPKIAL